MSELLALVALMGVPAALVTLIVMAALTVSRRRVPQPPAHASAGDPTARTAWASAYMAHVRLVRLERRVRDLETRTTTPSDRSGWR